jgi:hypothetical protein
MKRSLARGAARALVLLVACFGWALAYAQADGLGPAGLLERHAALAQQLADSPFGGPLLVMSSETGGRAGGDVFAVVQHPFGQVLAMLPDPGRWCDVFILHLNVKYCRLSGQGEATELEVRVGKKGPQAIHSASRLQFSWRPPVAGAAYVRAAMDAPEGPFDTQDYRLLVEAVPLGTARTFLHLAYGFRYGSTGRMAMRVYLATIGRDKVGFSREDPSGAEPVRGMRGVVERNAMRYYLAIEAYLGAQALPASQQLDARLQAWFDATERFPRQLRELERDEYLRMKRQEVRRQGG